MIDLWEKKVYHTPSDMFKRDDRLYLGDFEDCQAVLVFENWEFRIYSYHYDGDEDEREENCEWLHSVFQDFAGSFERGSLGFVVIEAEDEEDIVYEIIESCKKSLDYFSYFAEDSVEPFVRKHLKNSIRVYGYYK